MKLSIFTVVCACVLSVSCSNGNNTSKAAEILNEEVSIEQSTEEPVADSPEAVPTENQNNDQNMDNKQQQTIVDIKTDNGTIKVRLYDDTPIHRDNFVKLAKEGFYNGTLFHRVIKNFMVQAGDPDSKDAQPGQMLGMGDPGYTLTAEILPNHSHFPGVLAAARQGDYVNPERRSSGSQFYIVTGDASHLDGQYTVFGEVISGMDIVRAIEDSRTDRNDRPVEDIHIISMTVE